MGKRVKSWPALVLAGFLAAGCGGGDKGPGPDAAASRYLLPSEPAGARGVIQARKEVKDGDAVVLVGRIGGHARPWIEGRAGFWIVDASFKPCNEREDDQCKTPWDYCCDDTDELRKGMATVKVVDGEGKTVEEDARKLLGVKELQTVVVKGRAKRDESGNLTVLAEGVYPRPAGKK